MDIKLYVNISEPIKINKTITGITTLNGRLRNDTSITNPTILVENHSFIASGAARANYAYIPEFARYYYIVDATTIQSNLWMLSLKCDVLMSFKTGILSSIAIIEQTSELGVERVNNYVANDVYNRIVKDKTDIIQFESGFSDTPYYILITAGGITT